MKKSVIMLTVVLVACIAATFAVYKLYVEQRMKQLAEHIEEEKKLQGRISELQDTFSSTEPQLVLEAWQEATQPWSLSVDRRANFFTLGDFVPEITIPEGEIPKFYYREELPKLKEQLRNYALQKNVEIADINCNVPSADFYRRGSNPSAEEIVGHLRTYHECAGFTRMLIDAGPTYLAPLTIWPEREQRLRSGGNIVFRTVGIQLDIRMEPLTRFLDKMSLTERYFRVENLKVANKNLLDRDPVLNVEMTITQAYSKPPENRGAETGGGGSAMTTDLLSSLFGTSKARVNKTGKKRDSLSWWQKFLKKYIPY